MPEFVLEVKASAQKELDALDDATFSRIDRRILALAETPRPVGCKKLRGYKDLWRIRVGNYRIVYAIDDKKSRATIIRVAHRRDVYED